MMKYFIPVIIMLLFLGLFLGLIGVYEIFNCPQQLTVVKIKVEGKNIDFWTGDYEQWQGSGVFVADDLILTAGHIVEDANEILIIWPDDKKHLAVSWYQESEADLGLIYIRTLEIESVAKFDDAIIGEEVWALGNPYAVFPVLTKGIISAIDILDDFAYQKNMIITDTAIEPGNSGCPLFDKDNNILGICSWGYTYAQGMSYFTRAEVCELTLNKYRAIQELQETE